MAAKETVCEEAQRITHTDRRDTYGSPLADFTRTAAMWSAILGCPVEPDQVAMCMIAVKLSRHTHHPMRDNIVDIAGYANCIGMMADEQGEW